MASAITHFVVGTALALPARFDGVLPRWAVPVTGGLLAAAPDLDTPLMFALDILHLRPGAKVGLAVQRGRLVVKPQQRPRYTLDELLAQCNPRARRSKEEREWLDGAPVGGELI